MRIPWVGAGHDVDDVPTAGLVAPVVVSTTGIKVNCANSHHGPILKKLNHHYGLLQFTRDDPSFEMKHAPAECTPSILRLRRCGWRRQSVRPCGPAWQNRWWSRSWRGRGRPRRKGARQGPFLRSGQTSSSTHLWLSTACQSGHKFGCKHFNFLFYFSCLPQGMAFSKRPKSTGNVFVMQKAL